VIKLEKKEDIIQETNEEIKEAKDTDVANNESIQEEKIEVENREDIDGNPEDNQDEQNEIIQKKDQEIADLNNKLMRLQADFINYKNRVEKDKKNIYSYALEDIITQLLPVLDNFERALSNMDEDNSYYQGVKMIYNQMLDVLNKNGLKEIDCEDKYFDPNFHHAVISEESDKDEGMILEVLQKGYMLNDKVIRPTMVKVAK